MVDLCETWMRNSSQTSFRLDHNLPWRCLPASCWTTGVLVWTSDFWLEGISTLCRLVTQRMKFWCLVRKENYFSRSTTGVFQICIFGIEFRKSLFCRLFMRVNISERWICRRTSEGNYRIIPTQSCSGIRRVKRMENWSSLSKKRKWPLTLFLGLEGNEGVIPPPNKGNQKINLDICGGTACRSRGLQAARW